MDGGNPQLAAHAFHGQHALVGGVGGEGHAAQHAARAVHLHHAMVVAHPHGAVGSGNDGGGQHALGGQREALYAATARVDACDGAVAEQLDPYGSVAGAAHGADEIVV